MANSEFISKDGYCALVSIARAAEMLAISPKHLRSQFVNTGKLKVIPLGKGPKGDRIDPLDIDNLIKKMRVSRCCTNEVKSGGSSLRLVGKPSSDPLGLPRKVRQGRRSAG